MCCPLLQQLRQRAEALAEEMTQQIEDISSLMSDVQSMTDAIVSKTGIIASASVSFSDHGTGPLDYPGHAYRESLF